MRVQVFITERIVDQIAEDVDIAFKVGTFIDPTLVARKLLAYRHQVIASPKYLAKRPPLSTPQDLLDHKLLEWARQPTHEGCDDESNKLA